MGKLAISFLLVPSVCDNIYKPEVFKSEGEWPHVGDCLKFDCRCSHSQAILNTLSEHLRTGQLRGMERVVEVWGYLWVYVVMFDGIIETFQRRSQQYHLLPTIHSL